MSLTVKHAVYGAAGKASEVTTTLQTLLNNTNGVVVINDSNFGDPSKGNVKQFGALVTRNGADFYFACTEGQTIDFKDAGGTPRQSSAFAVQFAVYGALPGGSDSKAQAFDVTSLLQQLINGSGGVVKISNDTLGGDPSPGNQKHFAALILHAGRSMPFACLEGQTLDFFAAP